MYAAATPPTELFPDQFECWSDSTDPLYQDMDDPIPLEDRGAAVPPAIDAARIASRDPETVDRTARRMLAGSFHEWMAQTIMEEEAARKIQLFVRPRLPTGLSTTSTTSAEEEEEDEEETEEEEEEAVNKTLAENAVAAMRQTDTTLSFASVDMEEEPEMEDDDHLQYEVFLWHGSHLGLEFYACNMTNFPCVEDANGNETLPGMWNVRQGDYLVSINDCSTHNEEMPFDSVVQILEDGVRPAILRFRRPRLQEMRYRSSIARMSMTTRGSMTGSSAKKEIHRRRERLERSLCYVVWREEDGPLGIALKQPTRSKPYPTVSEVSASEVVARESERNPIKAGDLLLSINHMDVSALGHSQSLKILKFAPRPLVLTFRRSAPDYPIARSLEL